MWNDCGFVIWVYEKLRTQISTFYFFKSILCSVPLKNKPWWGMTVSCSLSSSGRPDGKKRVSRHPQLSWSFEELWHSCRKDHRRSGIINYSYFGFDFCSSFLLCHQLSKTQKVFSLSCIFLVENVEQDMESGWRIDNRLAFNKMIP